MTTLATSEDMARVDDAFGNAFMVEVEDFFAQHEIFQQGRTARA